LGDSQRIKELEKQLAKQGMEAEQKLAQMSEEYEKKLSQSAAMASMKQILKDKNAMINSLRERLSKYEQDG
jgi:hypothetical protein